MKLTLLLTFALALQLNARTYGQSISIDVRNAQLKDVLKEVKDQSGYAFFLDDMLLSRARPVTLRLNQVPVDKALQRIFRDQPFGYAVSEKIVSIKELTAITHSTNGVSQTPPQPVLVSGIVTDSTGTPLAGVTIAIAGETSRGTLTGENGRFQIEALPEATLVFRYLGYATQEIPINGNNEIRVVLSAKSTLMDELIVVGYGDQKKINITGAVSQTGKETFSNRPITNVAQGLQGVLPNLNISFSDGQPGRGASFNIRGTTSINGGSALILIDGVPGDINLINPEDIEQVTVLKDAASAAIYGARAAFGVILITTSRGSASKPQIRYTNNFGIGKPTRIPNAVKDPLIAAQIQNEAYRGFSGAGQAGLERTIDYLLRRQDDPTLPELGSDAAGNWIHGATTDWYGEFYNDSQPFSKHYLSVSGGTGKFNYHLSGGLLDQRGAFKISPDDYRKYNFSAKLDIQVNDWLKIFDNVEYNRGSYDSPNKMIATNVNVFRYLSLGANSYYAIRTPDGNYTAEGARAIGVFSEGGRVKETEAMFKNTVGFQMSFLNRALKLNGDYTILSTQTLVNQQRLPIAFETRKGVFSEFHADNYYAAQAQVNHQIVNLYGSYEKRFGDHYISVLPGFNGELNQRNAFNVSRDFNISTDHAALDLTSGNLSAGDSKTEWALMGFFYRANYQFKDRYLLELNGRYDGTSRFPKVSRFGFFPSISAGWILSQERFFQPLKPVVDVLKIRGSYGSLGNQLVSNYAYITAMDVSQIGQILEGVRPLATRAPALRSANLTWETSRTINLGADASLFGERLQAGFDWYRRETLDMLAKGKTLPAVLGTTEPQINAANLATKGWELSLNWREQKTAGRHAWGYHIGGVLADSRTFITRFDNPNQFLGDYYEGQEIGEIWGYRTLGFFKTDDEYRNHADQSRVQTILYNLDGHPLAGDLKFADLNNDGEIFSGQNTVGDPGDMRIIGNSTPRLAYGINLAFNWSNFSVSAFFQGVGKRDFWPDRESGVFWGFYNRWNQPVWEHIRNNYWTPENPDAYFPRLRSYIAFNDTRSLGAVQTRYLQDASYLRFKNLTVSYSIPKPLLERIHVGGARVFFSGQNIFEWTRLSKAFDPETTGDEPDTGSRNGNGFVYPIQRVYTAGIEINL
ncbi:TonB-dependent receptor [Parapedobacter sp. 10938]|uniref:TonB-dependent receptor n=1 Tax=Parapedobacter flavus TaxID=3110225 RepID=UPI002DBF0E6C|nr:TonB-dependent receptor [Parapedobacter sp. 10938]MEC3880095.1 TonB-dependent receptor [Parapedobacter sp. 10938]